VSFSSAFAHGVITQPSTLHLCYYHTPTRFLWDYYFPYLKERGWDKGLKATVIQRFLHHLRQWDYIAAQRPDVCFANSKTVQKRLAKFYHRDSEVLYPGVDIAHYSVSKTTKDYYVTVCRLTPPKRLELAVQACTELKRELHVIGTGEDKERLQRMAGPTIKFLGFLSDDEVASELQNCRALLWPGIDDFGLVPVEAMAAGRPVVAYNKDGATETVVQGKTGILFDDHSTSGMKQAILDLEKIEDTLDPHAISTHAQQFSKEAFHKNLKNIIEREFSKK